MYRIPTILRLLRPEQWVKNAFVLLPLFFGGRLFDIGCVTDSLWVFAAFCLISSSVYCVNDALDADTDRQHPCKSRRPVAAGDISKRTAYLTASILSLAAVPICLASNICSPLEVMAILYGYLAMNLAYSLGAKQILGVDVLILSAGFVCRVWAGGVGTGIRLSFWIVLMTFLLTLFLALSKRRDDLLIYTSTGKKMRSYIDRISPIVLDRVIRAAGGLTFGCYMLYTVSDEVTSRLGTHYVFITGIFVLLGLMRYLHITLTLQSSGSPTGILLHDRWLQADIALWIASFAIIIYYPW